MEVEIEDICVRAMLKEFSDSHGGVRGAQGDACIHRIIRWYSQFLSDRINRSKCVYSPVLESYVCTTKEKQLVFPVELYVEYDSLSTLASVIGCHGVQALQNSVSEPLVRFAERLMEFVRANEPALTEVARNNALLTDIAVIRQHLDMRAVEGLLVDAIGVSHYVNFRDLLQRARNRAARDVVPLLQALTVDIRQVSLLPIAREPAHLLGAPDPYSGTLVALFSSVFKGAPMTYAELVPTAFAVLLCATSWQTCSYDMHKEAFSNNAHLLPRLIEVYITTLATLITQGVSSSGPEDCVARFARTASFITLKFQSYKSGDKKAARHASNLMLWMDLFLSSSNVLPGGVVESVLPQSLIRPHVLDVYQQESSAYLFDDDEQ